MAPCPLRVAPPRGAFLVIAATGDRAVDRARLARRRAALAPLQRRRCAGSLQLHPAVHLPRDPIAVAVSTGGASPALAKRLRDRIGEVVEPHHADLALRLQALRPWAKEHYATYDDRRVFFEQLVEREL